MSPAASATPALDTELGDREPDEGFEPLDLGYIQRLSSLQRFLRPLYRLLGGVLVDLSFIDRELRKNLDVIAFDLGKSAADDQPFRFSTFGHP